MTTAEDQARAAMRESVQENRHEVALAGETIRLLHSGLRAEVRDAVSEGIAAALTDENARRFFAMFLEVAQEQAAKQAGLLVWGGVKRILMAGALATLVWTVAGPTAAKLVLAAFNKGA